MDDWLSGGDDELEASALSEEAVRVMGEASMPLASAASKFQELGSQVVGSGAIKVLGMFLGHSMSSGLLGLMCLLRW